jgi:hypothetical protein
VSVLRITLSPEATSTLALVKVYASIFYFPIMYACTIQQRSRKCFLRRKRLRPRRRRRIDKVVLFVYLFMCLLITFFIRFILQKHRLCGCMLLRVTQVWVEVTSQFRFHMLRVALWRQRRRFDVCQCFCC